MSELRKDPIIDRWVIIAPGREKRPNYYKTCDREGEGGPKSAYIVEPGKLIAFFYEYRTIAAQPENNSGANYPFFLMNMGANAGGAENSHPETVLLKETPKLIKTEIESAKKYYEEYRRCIFCEMVNYEQAEKSRIVVENSEFMTLCPYASRYPYEMWILPKKHQSSFGEASKREIAALSDCIQDALLRLKRVIKTFDYNFILHTSPLQEMKNHFFHWHLEIIVRRSAFAGFEIGTGFYINHKPPETAAKELASSKPLFG